MNKKFIWIIAAIILIYFAIGNLSGFYTDYEWFRINGGLKLFWILFFSKFNVGFFFTVLFVILFFLNFLLIRILGGKGRIFTNNILDRLKLPVLGSPRKALLLILGIGVVAVGILMGSAASVYWKEYLMFTHSVPFTGYPADPVFAKNISFYIFSLPFYRFIYGWLMSSVIIITLFSVFFHFINGGISIGNGIEFSLFSRAHISSLLGLIVLINGIGYRLSAYALLFRDSGKFFGAGYTSVHANLIAYDVAMVLSFIAAALLFMNLVLRSFKLPVAVLVILIPAYFIMGTIVPAVQQRFIVDPNELGKEKPYILNNINFTRRAYGIQDIKEISFANTKNLTYNDIRKNKDTISNVRLWDWRPLKQTYKQLQELKPYYYFNDVDVDRYNLSGHETAVNLSARELSLHKFAKANRTWQNTHLIYTHGYGAVLSRVDRVTPEGQPELLIYDIPPKSDIGIKIDRPELYYGEHKNAYVITNTSIKPGEFDYPWGDDNKYTTYQGTGGTKLNSFFKRLLFAVSFGDINILISGEINTNSRILYKRNIMKMVSTMTPFLEIDNDPYLVISEGKMYWVVDAFTSSDQFPYSTPMRVGGKRINYIRNSVKIVIDAYNGSMKYYVIDKKDPVIEAYAKIFPGFFRDISEISPDLKSHLRYSKSMFDIQCNILKKYHMTDPNVFYNNEDAWDLPNQIYESNEEQLKSYYLVTRLPDEKESEFIIIMPFTPFKKNNMISFLTASCDFPNYGQLKLYQLPKEKLSYGPLLIEGRIDQDPEISKQLTLWSQKGSSVIRGNMLAIPIEESLLFIEPLYLKAESSAMPELKQVIVAFNDKIVMEKDLASAIEKLFYTGSFMQMDDSNSTRPFSEKIKDLSSKAYTHYSRAEQRMKAGDWKGYGDELKKLKEVLSMMKNMKE